MTKSRKIETCNLYSLNDKKVSVEIGGMWFGSLLLNEKKTGAPYGVTIFEDRISKRDLGGEGDQYEDLVIHARDIAEDIVNRYVGEGLFLAEEDDKPSPEEIAKAEQEFELADQQRMVTAQMVWDAKHDRSKIDIRARDAARRRNQTVEWAMTQTVDSRACPACGEGIRSSALKCKHCGEWLSDKRPDLT